MTDTEGALRDGLLALEGTHWSATPLRRAPGRGGRMLVRVALAVTTLAVVAGGTFVVGAVRLGESDVRSAPGVFDAGQPLHCSGLDELTLADADRAVRAPGFTVMWQIENPAGDPVMAAVPPATGSSPAGC